MRAAARRGVRWLLGGSGPLKRGTDRVEAVSRLVVVLVALAAVPAALLIAGAVRSHLDGVAAAQAATRHSVTAHLLQDAPESPASADPNADPTAPVPARVGWTTPAGDRRTATVPVPPSARAGTAVGVWLKADGGLAPPPTDPRTIADDVACAGILSAAVLPVLALGAHRIVLLLLDRRRARQWATDWQAVEPVWTARRG